MKVEKPKKDEVLEGEIVTEPIKKSSPETPPPSREPKEDDFVKPTTAEEAPALSEGEGFGSQLDEFLQELNLSKGQVFRAIGCVVLIAILAIGGVYGYRYYKNRQTPVAQVPEEPKQNEVTAEQTGIVASQQAGQLEILRPELVGDTGMNAVVSIGKEVEEAADISKYIMLFSRMQNAYAVNINDLLNRSTDRRGSLSGHVALLKKLYDDGTSTVVNLQNELDTIRVQYDPQAKRQDEDDANFFEQLNALNAKTAEDILADFINVSRQTVSLRARFKAIQRIKAFYDQGLPKLAAKIKDIELNEEPLVAGVKVYDVTGSDLQLILPYDSGVTDHLQSPAFPLIPTVQPYQSTGGKDFITQPGGGFEGYIKK